MTNATRKAGESNGEVNQVRLVRGYSIRVADLSIINSNYLS